MPKKKKIITMASSIIGTLALVLAIPFTVLGIKTASLNADYSYL